MQCPQSPKATSEGKGSSRAVHESIEAPRNSVKLPDIKPVSYAPLHEEISELVMDQDLSKSENFKSIDDFLKNEQRNDNTDQQMRTPDIPFPQG